MKYLHTLDPYELEEQVERENELEYFASVAELEREDRLMERYYEDR